MWVALIFMKCSEHERAMWWVETRFKFLVLPFPCSEILHRSFNVSHNMKLILHPLNRVDLSVTRDHVGKAFYAMPNAKKVLCMSDVGILKDLLRECLGNN